MELPGLEKDFVDEILRQILDNALNLPACLAPTMLMGLPNFSLVKGAWMLNEDALEAIRQASSVLGMRIYELASTRNIPGIGDSTGLRYVMEKRVGSDIYLRLL